MISSAQEAGSVRGVVAARLTQSHRSGEARRVRLWEEIRQFGCRDWRRQRAHCCRSERPVSDVSWGAEANVESGDSRGFNLISPHFARFGTHTAPMYGLKQHVTAETTERLAALAPHAHPFPGPTAKPALAAVGPATPLVAAATKPEDALDPAAG
jgi:hypothetical protein